MNLKELRARLAALSANGATKVKDYETLRGKQDRTAEDEAKLTALDAEIDQLEAQAEELRATIDAEEKRARRAGAFTGTAPGAAIRAPITTNEPNPATTAGFRNIAEFAVSVRNAVVNPSETDDRLRASPSNFHQNSGTAGEGYLVPPQFRETIWELVFGERDLLSLITTEPTASNVVQIPKDETTPWGASGVQAYWRAEGSQMTPSKAALIGSTVNLHELYAFVTATDELLADAPRLANRLTIQAARAIRYKAGEAIMWGDGVGKPLGFMASAAKIAVAKESGQAADTIVTANVLKQYSRLQGMGSRAFWAANRDIVPQVAVMTIGDQPVWTSGNQGMQNAPQGSLLGLPIVYLEHSKTLGDEGDLVLVDPDGYYAATKAGGGIDFASSIHLYFDYGVQAFRWTFRLGGQPYLSAPVSPAKGSNTRSHFVALADRA
jgi:HK97 family phage major capsid protein